MHLPLWRSLLFVPGTRSDRFAKAAAAGADAICMDLEDSVAPSDKASARQQICTYLSRARPGQCARSIRINALAGPDGLRDLLAIADSSMPPDAVLLPKVESGEVAQLAVNVLAGRPVVALIETVAGLRAADAIARVPGVVLLCFGSADYAAEVGCAFSATALASPRAHLAQAAAAAGISCMDGAWLALDDPRGLEEDCAVARAAGFCGKPALHPNQVKIINAAFTPDAEAIAEARAVVRALAMAGGGVTVHNGRMLDAPLVRQAERVLALAQIANRHHETEEIEP